MSQAGGVSVEQQHEAEQVTRNDSFGSLFNKSLHIANSGMVLWDTVSRAADYAYDPSFSLEAEYGELTAGVPAEFHDKFKYARSKEHALAIKRDIKQDIQDIQELGQNGIGGMAAILAAGVVDVDMLLGYGKAASLGRKAATAARIMKGAAVGGASGLLTESLIAEFGDVGQWQDVPAAMLMGATLGGIGGALARDVRPGMSVRAVEDAEFNPVYRMGEGEFADAAVAPRQPVPGVISVTPESARIAARQLQEFQTDVNADRAMSQLTDPIDDYTGARVFTPTTTDPAGVTTIGQRAGDLIDSLNLPDRSTRTGWLGAFTKLMDTAPLSDLTTRLWNSGSTTARAVAVSLFESAEGFFVNNRSAAIVQDSLMQRGYKTFAQDFDDVLREGKRKLGIGLFDIKRGRQYQAELSEQVVLAANDMRLGRSIDHYSAEVKKLLAKVDEFSDFMRNEARGGASGGRMVPGFENVERTKSYIPLIWSGEKMRRVLAGVGRARVVRAVAAAYRAAHPNMTEADSTVLARALVRRGESKGATVDTNLNAMLANDGKEFLRQALIDNGTEEQVANALIDRLSVRDADKGKVGYARHRVDIDLSGTYEGIKISDLIDTDLNRVMYGYADTMSKRIALSRHGIDNTGQIEHIKNLILTEAAAKGKSTGELTTLRRDLDQAFQHFLPGSLDQNINPWIRRAKQTTNLSLLGKLGLPQLAETGAIMAVAGVQNFLAASPVFRRFVNGMNHKQVLDDLGWMAGNLGYERGILRSDLVADLALDGVKGNNTFTKRLDDMLAQGQHIQGIISGYTKVMEAQIHTAALSFTNKLFRILRDGTEGKHTAFFRSAGIGTDQLDKLRELVTNGTVKFNKDGHVDALNPDKWDAILRDRYGMSTLRAVRQMVQRPLAGEQQPWLHDASLSIFGHLQTFPLLSMRKQFMRNVMKGDGSFAMLTLYGLGTAAVAGAVRNFTEGKEQTAASIAKASLSYSNAIGWTTLGIDPIARLVGLEDYAPGGRYSGEFQLPMLSVASQATGIPEALVSAVVPGAKFTKSDKKAMQVIPVVGSFYGVSRLLDGLVDE